MDPIRKKMLRELMERHQTGAMIFWRPDELVMLLGYMPLWGLSFLLYTADDRMVLYVPELEPEDILPAGPEIVKYPWGLLNSGDPWEWLFQKMRGQLTVSDCSGGPLAFIRSVGGTAPCRMTAEQPPLPANLVNRLESLVPAGFKDIAADLLRLYQYKTARDISAIKLAHRVAAEAVKTFYASVRGGTAETEVAAAMEAAVQKMTGTDGIDFAKAWPMVQSGGNACFGGRYNRSSAKKLMAGELVMVEMGVCVNGYWADITRTASVGRVSARQEKIFYTVRGAQRAALSLMRPGAPMSAVDDAARQHISAAGWGHLFNHALGHQTGFRYHDPGPVLSPGSTGVLEEGMLLTVEPGIYGPELGAGVRIEDNVLITKNGYELLSDYPAGLTGNDIG
jgi:Xaa-Pro aminopeptidase